MIKMQIQFCWFPGEETYLFQKSCIGFFCVFFELKIQTQFDVFLVQFKIYTCYELEFWICCSLWHVQICGKSLHDFDVYMFSYNLCKFYARLSLMLFIASLMNFSLSTSAPQSFALLSSTSGKINMILGFCLNHVMYLIQCRLLN